MTVWRYHLDGYPRTARKVALGLAAAVAAAAFAATSLTTASPARATACSGTSCGTPLWNQPHGEIGTPEIAHRVQPLNSAATADLVGRPEVATREPVLAFLTEETVMGLRAAGHSLPRVF